MDFQGCGAGFLRLFTRFLRRAAAVFVELEIFFDCAKNVMNKKKKKKNPMSQIKSPRFIF